MGADERGTLQTLKSHRRDVFEVLVGEHGGRIVKSTGDGLLIEYPSVVNAMRSAILIQRAMADRNAGVAAGREMLFRMGLHVGDIIVDDDDIFGDGVNVAARLEPLAAPGGICLSDRVYWDVHAQVEGPFHDHGDQRLKNIASPVRVWQWTVEPTSAAPRQQALVQQDDRPSLAVLPFVNSGDNPDQEYLADGVTEDVITDLSRFRSLFVIARNSSFSYKRSAVDVREVGRELGVRYVVEGSIRHAGRRVRTTAKLIECASGQQLWADRYEGTFDNIFDLQDELTSRIVSSLVPEMTKAEIGRAMQKKGTQLSAWDLYLRSLPKIRSNVRSEVSDAETLLSAAIATDPSFGGALAKLSACRLKAVYMGWGDEHQAMQDAMSHARAAVAADPGDGLGFDALASVQQRLGQAHMQEAVASARQAIALAPSLVAAYGTLISALAFCGNHEEAREVFRDSERLSPRDPDRSSRLMGLIVASFVAGRFADVADLARQHMLLQPNWYGSHTFLASSLALLGQREEARAIVERLRKLIPGYDLSWARRRRMLLREEDYASFMEGLRLAGVPDA